MFVKYNLIASFFFKIRAGIVNVKYIIFTATYYSDFKYAFSDLFKLLLQRIQNLKQRMR